MSPAFEQSSRSWIKIDGHSFPRYIDVPMVDVPKSDAFSQRDLISGQSRIRKWTIKKYQTRRSISLKLDSQKESN